MHNVNDLINIFNTEFFHSHNTQLCRGGGEPIYLPVDKHHAFHRIIFANGFYSSGLHEIAHWLVAGEKRRLLEDYGYWYKPDGRDYAAQCEFEKVEVKPQAIEWMLSVCAGIEFNVSVDNLNGHETCRFGFQQAVHAEVINLIEQQPNARTLQLLKALCTFYNTPWPITAELFNWQAPEEFLDAV